MTGFHVNRVTEMQSLAQTPPLNPLPLRGGEWMRTGLSEIDSYESIRKKD